MFLLQQLNLFLSSHNINHWYSIFFHQSNQHSTQLRCRTSLNNTNVLARSVSFASFEKANCCHWIHEGAWSLLPRCIIVESNTLICICYGVFSITSSFAELATTFNNTGESDSLSLERPSQHSTSRFDDGAGSFCSRNNWILKGSTVISLHHIDITRINWGCLDLDQYLSVTRFWYFFQIRWVWDDTFCGVNGWLLFSWLGFHLISKIFMI